MNQEPAAKTSEQCFDDLQSAAESVSRLLKGQYDLRGSCCRDYLDSKIDIRKTFGIDADSVPPNWKPEAK